MVSTATVNPLCLCEYACTCVKGWYNQLCIIAKLFFPPSSSGQLFIDFKVKHNSLEAMNQNQMTNSHWWSLSSACHPYVNFAEQLIVFGSVKAIVKANKL